MAKESFKFIPRTKEIEGKREFTDNRDKRKNIINFFNSMDIHKDDNGNIINYEDFFFFNKLYASIETIMRNEDILKDKNTKSKIHTIISSSSTSDSLAYIADNIVGVIESMKKKMVSLGNDESFTEMKKVAEAWEKANKEAKTHIDKLTDIVDKNLEKGYGSNFQLRKVERKKLDDNKEEIEKQLLLGKTPDELSETFKIDVKLFHDLVKSVERQKMIENEDQIKALFEKGKNFSEIAEELKLKPSLVDKFTQSLLNKKLDANISTIKTKIAENVSYKDIAQEQNVSVNKLKKFVSANNLALKTVQKVASV